MCDDTTKSAAIRFDLVSSDRKVTNLVQNLGVGLPLIHE